MVSKPSRSVDPLSRLNPALASATLTSILPTDPDFQRANLMRFSTLLVVLASALPSSVRAADEVDFVRQIAPLLREHCLACHAGKDPKGDTDLTSAAGLKAATMLLENVSTRKMPPKKPLSTEQIALVKRWIDGGAKWTGPNLNPLAPQVSQRAGADWWSLQPVRNPPVPKLADAKLIRNPIDAFVRARHAELKLTPQPEIDRRRWLRRVTFDLTGLLPTPEEVEAFTADVSPGAYEAVADRLLASTAYGETWARHWLDIVRFAESNGYEVNSPRTNAWPYRDYVIKALNDDLPYRDFIRHQLAADRDPKATPATLAATGFLVAGPHDMVGDKIVEAELQKRSNDLADMVSITSTTFLGMSVGCARCHDHKFDPIPQKDFYALEAVFAGVYHGDSPSPPASPADLARVRQPILDALAKADRQLDSHEPLAAIGTPAVRRRPALSALRNVERFAPVEAKFVRTTIARTKDGIEPCIDELEVFGEAGENLAAAAGVVATASSEYPNSTIHRIAHLNDGRPGNDFSWISNEKGKGQATLEFPTPVRIERVVWARDRLGRFGDRLAAEYTIEVSLDGKKWQTVATHADRRNAGEKAPPAPSAVALLMQQRDDLLRQLQAVSRRDTTYRGVFQTSDRTYLLKRGDILQKGDEVAPAAMTAVRIPFPTGLKSEGDRRAALADWIGHPDNPLTARVLVNRLWHYHFGQGLVRTPGDFGFNGDRPSHPELLDWLATEFQTHNGSLKHMHRLMVLSSTYRRDSKIDAGSVELDADNRGLWRFSSRRLEAEKIRDAILQVSGSINRKRGGEGYHIWTYSNYVTIYKPKLKLGEDEFRRMIYQFKPRTQQDGTFGVFDCPDAASTMPRRTISTTPLQALNLFNDEFVLDQADRFAGRIGREAGADPAAQIDRAFRLAYDRLPSPRERDGARSLVEAAGLASLCRAIFNSNEFVMQE